jgi:hypothetical protein
MKISFFPSVNASGTKHSENVPVWKEDILNISNSQKMQASCQESSINMLPVVSIAYYATLLWSLRVSALLKLRQNTNNPGYIPFMKLT